MSLTNAQYDAVMRIYSERQLDAQHAQEARMADAYAAVPRLAEIDEEIAAASLAQARARVLGTTEDRGGTRLQDLAEERAALLLSSGYPRDYLEPHYTCPDCRDTGYIGDKKCHCFRQLERIYLYSGSMTASPKKDETFDAFSLDYYFNESDPEASEIERTLAAKALEDARQFVRDFRTSSDNLLFYGDTGVGKTFLSNCIAHELIGQGVRVVYLTSYDLFQILAQSAFEHDDAADAQADEIFSCDLLIIDDLGAEMNNTFVSSRLFICINERILKKKSTIISTNFSLEHLRETYSDRTFSRIMSHYRKINLRGKDIRIRKQLTGGI